MWSRVLVSWSLRYSSVCGQGGSELPFRSEVIIRSWASRPSCGTDRGADCQSLRLSTGFRWRRGGVMERRRAGEGDDWGPRTGEECVPVCFGCLRKGQTNLIVSTSTLVLSSIKAFQKWEFLGECVFIHSSPDSKLSFCTQLWMSSNTPSFPLPGHLLEG